MTLKKSKVRKEEILKCLVADIGLSLMVEKTCNHLKKILSAKINNSHTNDASSGNK